MRFPVPAADSVIDPDVLVGKPIIRGTRIAVEFMVDLLAHGWDEGQIQENYPGIAREDILACLEYATEDERVRIRPL